MLLYLNVFAFVGHIDLSSRKIRDGLQGMVLLFGLISAVIV
jgi:hypothetical protein